MGDPFSPGWMPPRTEPVERGPWIGPRPRCSSTARTDAGIQRRCEFEAGHNDGPDGTDHEAWATGPNVLSGIIWSKGRK
jgi:hypothetical protein